MIDFLLLFFKYIPDIIVHCVVGIGILGIMLSTFYSSAMKNFGIHLLSFVILLIGVYMEGGLAVTKDYLDKQKIWYDRIAEADRKASEINERIEYVYKEKIQKSKKVKIIYRDRIKEISSDIDSKCKMSKDTIGIVNSSAKGVVR